LAPLMLACSGLCPCSTSFLNRGHRLPLVVHRLLRGLLFQNSRKASTVPWSGRGIASAGGPRIWSRPGSVCMLTSLELPLPLLLLEPSSDALIVFWLVAVCRQEVQLRPRSEGT
jgi:hypothetical protein